MRRDIALLTLCAALGLMGLSSGAAPIEPFSTIESGAKLVAQIRSKDAAKPWYNCTAREIWNAPKQAWCQKVDLLKNTKYQIPSLGLVQLKDGSYTNLTQKVRVVLVDKPGAIAFGDVNNDGKADATVLMEVNSVGSEALTYLSVVVSTEGLRNTASVLLGDRVKVQAIAIDATHIKVDLVKQGTNDPPCCPTQPVTQLYALQKAKLAPLLKPAARIKRTQAWIDSAKIFCS